MVVAAVRRLRSDSNSARRAARRRSSSSNSSQIRTAAGSPATHDRRRAIAGLTLCGAEDQVVDQLDSGRLVLQGGADRLQRRDDGVELDDEQALVPGQRDQVEPGPDDDGERAFAAAENGLRIYAAVGDAQAVERVAAIGAQELGKAGRDFVGVVAGDRRQRFLALLRRRRLSGVSAPRPQV